jgi:hypothetical protein
MGKIEIDHTGTGSGITLSSDGTDLLLNGTAIGGGGAALELYAENPSSPTAPSATGTNAVAIGSESVSAGLRSVSLGDSYASGIESFAAVIGSNTSSFGATGPNSIAVGREAKATGQFGVALGFSATASDAYAVALGNYAKASGYGSIAISGSITDYTEALQSYSVAIGFRAKSDTWGKLAYAGGRFSSNGDAQTGTFVLRSDTTDATPEALTTNNSTPSTKNQIILPNNSAYAFHGTIVARQQASQGTASAAWKVEGLIRREGSAGTTVLVNSATTVIDNTPSWGLALSADTTNGGLKIEFTGAAATNIRVVATVHTSEVTY